MKRIGMLGIWTLMLLGFAFGSMAWAQKPADLPLPSQHACPEGRDGPEQGSLSIKLDLLTGRITVEVTPAQVEPTPAIDTLTPMLLPGVIDQLVKQTGEVLLQRAAAVTGKDLEALRCFEKAERARMTRNLEAARRGYQQAHLLSPTSLLGRLAIVRLQQIEEQIRDASEESTDPPPLDPQSMYRDMNDRTVPLGLVYVSY